MREKQNVYEVFPLFIFYFESPKYEMEKTDFSFYGSLKFYWFGDFDHFLYRKVKETNIHCESFLNLILQILVYKSTYARKKNLINTPKCAESNFKKLSGWMLVSLTFLKKSYLRKTVLFRKIKSLRSHKTKTKR